MPLREASSLLWIPLLCKDFTLYSWPTQLSGAQAGLFTYCTLESYIPSLLGSMEAMVV